MPQYGEKFEYSHSHFLYTNDIQRLEDIPPPHVSPTRKQEIFDVDDYTHVDERTDAVGICLESGENRLGNGADGGYVEVILIQM